MSDADYERGRSDERLDNNDERHKENQKRFLAIEEKLAEIAQAMAMAKGGLRLLLAVASVSAGFGAFAHEIFSWLSAHWKG